MFGEIIVIDNANDLVVVTRWMDDSKMGVQFSERSISSQTN
jgi:hypothetical protein